MSEMLNYENIFRNEEIRYSLIPPTTSMLSNLTGHFLTILRDFLAALNRVDQSFSLLKCFSLCFPGTTLSDVLLWQWWLLLC